MSIEYTEFGLAIEHTHTRTAYAELGAAIDQAHAELAPFGAVAEIDVLGSISTGKTVIYYQMPAGQRLRMTGEFYVDSGQSHFDYWGPGSYEQQSFEGSTYRVTGEIDRYTHEPLVHIDVFGKTLTWRTAGLLPVQIPIPRVFEKHPNAPEEYDYYFVEVEGNVAWQRHCARGKVGEIVLEAVDADDQEDIVLPKSPLMDSSAELWLPKERTSTDYMRMRNEMLPESLQVNEQQLAVYALEEMRVRRYEDMPFTDDPLRYFRIARVGDIERFSGEGIVPQVLKPLIARDYKGLTLGMDIQDVLSMRMTAQEQPGALNFSMFDEKGNYRG